MTPPDAEVIVRAAEAAAGAQHYPGGALYVVATPIGNLADLTLRAIHVLGLVDAVACEDTRHTAPLLRRLGLDKTLLAVHQHNERDGAAAVVERLRRGERVAYVSDAGTPAVSDPGAVLVAAVAEAGLRVVPIPGPSSVLAALSVSGDAHGASFNCVGFVPAKGAERSSALRRIADDPTTQVLFEAPHRVDALATSLGELCPTRRLTVGRELTKQFEAVVTLAAGGLSDWLRQDANRKRGEFVFVLHAQNVRRQDEAIEVDLTALLQALLSALPLSRAVAVAGAVTGLPRNALYERALALRDGESGAGV